MATKRPSEELEEAAESLEKEEAKADEIEVNVRQHAALLEELKTAIKRLNLRLEQLSPTVPGPVIPPEPEPDPEPPPIPGPILPVEGKANPTFHCVGLYYQPPSNPGVAGVTVEYKKTSASVWVLGHPLWYDVRNLEARGSIVHLDPNTSYDVRFSMPGGVPIAGLTFSTWSEVFPEKSTTTWANGVVTDAKIITAGGSEAEGYVVYTSPAGGRTTLKQTPTQDKFPIRIKANYVIIRGVTIEGGHHAILIDPSCHHIVIEDNDISGWCRDSGTKTVEGWNRGHDRDSGIRLNLAGTPSPLSTHIVIQRNKIHDPNAGSNSWSGGHPSGPQAVTFSSSGGHHVLRYNEVYSATVGKWFNDGFSGLDNFSNSGFPSNDSDIYKNKISNVWDDGIEAEGGNKNVRIWGNYCDRVNVGVATTPVFLGPCYIWRNVQNRSRHYALVGLDGDTRNGGFKSLTNGSWGGGQRYIYHNTLLQWPGATEGATSPLGVGEGIKGATNQNISQTKSRNNILHVWKSNWPSIRMGSGSDPDNIRNNDFNYDLRNGTLNGTYTGAEANIGNTQKSPTYKAGHGPTVGDAGLYQLAAGTDGHDQGEVIPNFNDGFLGVAPDVGAHEEGTPAMQFGVTATGS